MAATKRIAACISYLGGNYSGWQIQPGEPSVQGEVEKALTKLNGSRAPVTAAGRTDSGVHAFGQFFHADVTPRPTDWLRGLNTYLPKDIRCLWASEVPQDFHARFSPESRSYVYLLGREPLSAWNTGRILGLRAMPDLGKMAAASRDLIGEHDFGSFRGAGCNARHAVRRIMRADWHAGKGTLAFQITADGFLLHQVRIIVGTLLEIGQGKREIGSIAELLACPDRKNAGETLPAHGLYMLNVRYPKKFGVPVISPPWQDLPSLA